MANKEQIDKLIRQHGNARASLSPGDKVLYDGATTGGEYVTLCTVIAVENDMITVQEEHTYYLNGGEFPERKISQVEPAYFLKPIWHHIQEGRDVFRRIADASNDKEE